jgi:hypothetical protein
MSRPRIAFGLPVLAIAACCSVSAQTVISTHSGVLYFFEGNVFLDGQRLEQKFGKFPDIGEGRSLRTEAGRAEVLLTPGVMLRIGDNSSIRMVSDKLSDTRVELLTGSAIVEVNQNNPDTSVALLFKDWQVRAPEDGVYRLDSNPAEVHVYKGQAEVSTGGKDPVTVKSNENLPLAAVLVPEPGQITPGDNFKTWAMNRSQAVSADNAIAGEIVDDPSQMNSTAGFDASGYTYFPMTGVPSLGITNPYGVSFWSPYQASLNAMYFPSYLYTPYYIGWPSGVIIYPRSILPGRIGIGTGTGIGLRPGQIPRTLLPGSPRTISSPRAVPSYRPAPTAVPRSAPAPHPAPVGGVHHR